MPQPTERGSLSEYLNTLPESAREVFGQGFRVSQTLTDDQLIRVVHIAVNSFGEDEELPSTLPPDLNLPDRSGTLLLSAVTVLIPTAVMAESPEEITKRLVDEKLVELTESHASQKLIELIRSTSHEVEQLFQQESLANSILPSFRSFGSRIDVRLEFDEKHQLRRSAAVAVAYLFTDASSQRVWFQMSKRQLKSLLKSVQRAVANMEEAEKNIDQFTAK
jgi:hypothetical protein